MNMFRFTFTVFKIQSNLNMYAYFCSIFEQTKVVSGLSAFEAYVLSFIK